MIADELGRKQLLVEGNDRRWREAIAGEGKRSQVKGSDRRWREAIAGGVKRSQVEESDCRCKGATAGGAETIEQARKRLQTNTERDTGDSRSERGRDH